MYVLVPSHPLCNADKAFSRLSLGTSSKPSSNRSMDMSEILDPRLFTGTATTEDVRTFRLRLSAHFLDIAQRGLEIKIKDLKTFVVEMDNIFTAFSRVRNCMQPLQGIRDSLFDVLVKLNLYISDGSSRANVHRRGALAGRPQRASYVLPCGDTDAVLHGGHGARPDMAGGTQRLERLCLIAVERVSRTLRAGAF